MVRMSSLEGYGVRRAGVGLLAAFSMMLVLGRCGRDPTLRVERATTTATPVPYVQPTEALVLPTPSPAAAVQSATIEVTIPAPTAVQSDVPIPNFDRPRDSAPESREQRLSRCLTYTVEEVSGLSFSIERVRLRVTARNLCSTWIPASDSWFEVEATPASGGGVAGRETGMFQAAIGPNAWGETLIEIDCPGRRCRYSAHVAGAGR
jgi:hypothetical protein